MFRQFIYYIMIFIISIMTLSIISHDIFKNNYTLPTIHIMTPKKDNKRGTVSTTFHPLTYCLTIKYYPVCEHTSD